MTFKQAKWSEPTLFELGSSGRRGFLLPPIEDKVRKTVGEIKIPEKILRRNKPNLPELSEVEIVRHYTRLTEMSYGVDNGPVPLGSCTMKYNPRIALDIASDPRITTIHPLQDEKTIQGLLEILYNLQF